jgi:hypothetical protein
MHQQEKREKGNRGATFHMIGYASNEGSLKKRRTVGNFDEFWNHLELDAAAITVIHAAAFSPKHFIAIRHAAKGAPVHIDYPTCFASYVCDDCFVAAARDTRLFAVAAPLCRDIHVLRLSKVKSEAELCFTAAIGIAIVLDCARFLSVGGASIGLCFLADETSFAVYHAREAPDEAVADVRGARDSHRPRRYFGFTGLRSVGHGRSCTCARCARDRPAVSFGASRLRCDLCEAAAERLCHRSLRRTGG